MPKRDPSKFEARRRRMDNMNTHLKKTRRPHIGVTQGGSSRKFAGAKPAATTAEVQKRSRKK